MNTWQCCQNSGLFAASGGRHSRAHQATIGLTFPFEEKATESMMRFGSVERRYLGYGVETVGALVLDL